MPKVKAEIKRMERLGVISRIEEPIEWCAGMVVVSKSRGKVCICVNLTRLNHSVQRERHILPAVDQTLARVTGTTVHPFGARVKTADYVSDPIWPILL